MLYTTKTNDDSYTFNLVELLEYEIFGVGNSEILDYFIENYLDEGELKRKAEYYTCEITIDGEAYEKNEEKQTEFCKQLIEVLNEKTGKNNKFAIWLGEKDYFENYCLAWSGNNIIAFEESDVILSDEDEIKLYAFAEMPEEIYL